MTSTSPKSPPLPKKIILLGGFGWRDIGDEAMPKSVIHNLKRELDVPIEVVMISPDPAYTATYHNARAIPDIDFYSCPKAFLKLFGKRGSILFNLLKFLWVLSLLRLFRLRITPPLRGNFRGIWNEMSHAHLLFNCGGGNLNSLMRDELLKKAAIHHMAHLLKVPVIVSGQTIGPIYNRIDRIILKHALDRARIITLRDSAVSAKRLAHMNVKGPLIADTADDALSLPAIPRDDALRMIQERAPKGWLEMGGAVFSLNIKASLSMWHSHKEAFHMGRAVQLFCAFARYLTSSLNGRVMLISTDYCPGSDDREILGEIYRRLPSKERVLFFPDELNDQEIKGILSLSDFCIGSRYHFEVFALSQFVPCIGIAAGEYQKTKLRGIHDLCGIPEFYIDTDLDKTDLRDLIALTHRLIREKDRVHGLLRERIPELISESMMTIHYARSLLSEGPAQPINGRWRPDRAHHASGASLS